MSPNQFIVLFYILWAASRARGCVRRWRQPLLRGPEWFFNVHVQRDFYSGPGRKILHAYWARMLMTVALELPIAAVIFISGHLQYLVWLVVAMAILIHVNHAFSVYRAERQASRFAVKEDERPAPAMVISLKTRRLRDYSNRHVERLVVFSTVLVIVWLVRYYFTAPEHHNLRLVFGEPALLLYMQAGLLLAKQIIVRWRSPIPQNHAEEHIEAREYARKLYLKVCDLNRILLAGMLLLWPFLLKTSDIGRSRLLTGFLVTLLIINTAVAVWYEVMRNKAVAASLRARPTKLPSFLQDAESRSWLLCYQPSVPMVVLKGTRGYSVNLANAMAQLSVAYVAGFIALMLVLTSSS